MSANTIPAFLKAMGTLAAEEKKKKAEEKKKKATEEKKKKAEEKKKKAEEKKKKAEEKKKKVEEKKKKAEEKKKKAEEKKKKVEEKKKKAEEKKKAAEEKAHNNQHKEIKACIKPNMIEQIKHISKEKIETRNISHAFRAVGDLGEQLAIKIVLNSFGSASKGGCAFDNVVVDRNGKIISATEVKTSCQMQPKECKNCHVKIPYYQPCCGICKHTDFKIIADTRFSINAKAHFEYKSLLKQYLLINISDSMVNNEYRIKVLVFVVKSDNIYFDNYINNQLHGSTKSNVCNLLPFSYDFYASGPIKIIELEYDLSANLTYEYINLRNNTSLDFDLKCLKKEEKIQYCIPDDMETMPYVEIKDRLELRKKNLNKNRGKTTRL